MGFQLGNILSSPFWLASIGIGIAAWIVAAVSTAFAAAAADHFAIWEAVFLLVPVIATVFAVGTDTIGAYRIAIFPFYVIGIVYATTTANAAIYLPLAEEKALGAGLLVLSATFFAWIIVAGVDRLLSSTGLSSAYGVATTKRQVQPGGYPVQQVSTRSAPPMQSVSVTATPQQTAANTSTVSTARPATSESTASGPKPAVEHDAAGAMSGVQVDVAPETVYGYRAQAMYSYTASVDDPNELSFTKGEMMDIVDNQGKWWQARKADGSIGIVPSNYMKLVQA